MFFFFSNRLGCLGSLLISIAITAALLFMFGLLVSRKKQNAPHENIIAPSTTIAADLSALKNTPRSVST
jgi:hypothetical protein